MKKYGLIIFLFLFQNGIFCQCVEESLVGSVNCGTGDKQGQSFTACVNGIIESFTFKTFNDWPVNTATLELRESSTFCGTVLWTVNNFPVPDGAGQIVTVDLSIGSGISRNVIGGIEYDIVISHSANPCTFACSTNNPYAGGTIIAGLNCVAISFADIWFSINIGALLPVELIEFQTNFNEQLKRMVLNWQTASQSKASHFSIQHSTNGTDFYDIGEIPAHGTTTEPHSYSFTHENPTPGDNYYRLKMVDMDGSFEYSKTVQARVAGQQGFRILPNPVAGGFRIVFDDIMESEASLHIYRMDGRLAHFKTLPSGTDSWPAESLELEPGIYWVTMSNEQGYFFRQKLVKL